MIELQNEPMSKHTTFRIGGPAALMLVPQTEEELIDAIRDCQSARAPYRVLGNGSNLLVSDQGLKCRVINNQEACTRLEYADGLVYAGSSVKLQAFIRFCTKQGLEGSEYLFSVPATIGGAIFMNAGRGRALNQQISDHLVSVRVFNGVNIIDIPKYQCDFRYRQSCFHERRDWVILGAAFRMPTQATVVGDAKVKERMAYVKETQDYNQRTAGSVFKVGRPRLYELVKGLKIGGAEYSRKTSNWINNTDSAKASDVIRLISVLKFLNILTFKRAEPEIEFWD